MELSQFIQPEIYQAFFNRVLEWAVSDGATIALIVVGIIVINKTGTVLIGRAIRKIVKGDPHLSSYDEAKREDTLIRVFRGSLKVLTWLLGGMMILSELGVEIGPLLAAAGVAGIAFGFGGQYLIRDLITGLFIILENQYRVGDVIQIGDKAGEVENINLRLTTIRDLDGTLHHIPNGEIAVASNFTKKFSRVHLNIGVGYDADIDVVQKTIDTVGKELAEDVTWSEKIISSPKFVRVNEFGDSAVVVKILGDIQPGAQWEVAGEFRKRLKVAFDKAGIDIPFPQRVVHQGK